MRINYYMTLFWILGMFVFYMDMVVVKSMNHWFTVVGMITCFIFASEFLKIAIEERRE